MDISISSKSIDSNPDKLYDFYKHITTLNTGSILIIMTFLQKFFDSTDSNILFCALGSLVISLVCATYAMNLIATGFSEKGGWKMVFNIIHLISWITFLIGILLLVYLAYKIT